MLLRLKHYRAQGKGTRLRLIGYAEAGKGKKAEVVRIKIYKNVESVFKINYVEFGRTKL